MIRPLRASAIPVRPRRGAFLLFLAIFAFSSVHAETRSAADVFAKWRTGQRVFSDLNLRRYRTVDDDFLSDFRDRFPAALRSQAAFLPMPPGARPLLRSERKVLQDELKALVAELDDTRGLLRHLKKKKFSGGKINDGEKKAPFRVVSAKYREFLEALLTHPEDTPERTALFAAANRFFEYCFFPRRHSDCISLTRRPADHPLLRFLYSNMWYHLSGIGWQHWHEDALEELEERSRDGDEIVYIAGGTDIYKLLARRMTRLRVIDPIFPSQTKYYSEGWRFLVEPSGRGQDKIVFTEAADGVDLTMVRKQHRTTGKFSSGELSDNSKRTLPKTHTVWGVLDANQKEIGQVVYERRFVTQQDFVKTDGRTLLISFNEMNYVAATDDTGWGLRPDKFPRSMRIVVKQLRKPISRAVLLNLEEMRNTDFYFIKLGTSIN